MTVHNKDWLFIPHSDIGDREQQQDRAAVFHSPHNNSHLLVVADGMGGHENGAWAAQTVLDIAQTCLQQQDTIHNPAQFLRGICTQAHKTIREYEGSGKSAPGSTCVILYLTETEAHWVHVGDSRLYYFQEGELRTLTNDHSADQLATERDDETKGIQNHLYMCLGGENDVNPDYDYVSLSGKDFFLLCSDGLWNQTAIEQNIAQISDKDTMNSHLKELVQQAKTNHAGKSDNISLLAAYREVAPRPRKSGFSWFRWLKK